MSIHPPLYRSSPFTYFWFTKLFNHDDTPLKLSRYSNLLTNLPSIHPALYSSRSMSYFPHSLIFLIPYLSNFCIIQFYPSLSRSSPFSCATSSSPAPAPSSADTPVCCRRPVFVNLTWILKKMNYKDKIDPLLTSTLIHPYPLPLLKTKTRWAFLHDTDNEWVLVIVNERSKCEQALWNWDELDK